MNPPPYSLFPVLQYPQVTLHQILPKDVESIIDISFYSGKKASNLQEANVMQHHIHQDYLKGNSIHWGIAENKSNQLIGTVGYYRGFENGAGELGCVLLANYQGKGYMTKAMQLAIDFGIHKMQLQKIWAATHTHNVKAKELLSRLLFVQIEELENDLIRFEYPKNIL